MTGDKVSEMLQHLLLGKGSSVRGRYRGVPVDQRGSRDQGVQIFALLPSAKHYLAAVEYRDGGMPRAVVVGKGVPEPR
jgi:hypothetical protein